MPVGSFSVGLVFATVILMLGILVGRVLERGSEVGRLLASAPVVDSLKANLDTSRVLLNRLHRLAR